MLKCTRCKQEKPANADYFPLHNKKKNGLDSWCRSCRSTYRSETRRGYYRDMIADSDLKTIIATTFECVICGDRAPLVVDHSHTNHKIRGMLCNRCNQGLGLFRDDPELLEYARIYLLAADDEPEAGQYVKEHSGLNLYGDC